MNTTLINSKNDKNSYLYKLLLNLINKIDLRKGEKVLHYQVLLFTVDGKT